MTTTLEHPAVTTTRQGIPFARLVRVEIRKSTDTRAAKWVLAAAFLISLVTAIIPIFPDDADQTLSFYVTTASLGFSVLLPVVAILFVTAEWSQRTALTTFTQEPRRQRVLAAKVVVATILSLVAALATLLFAAGSLAIAGVSGRDISWSFDGGDLSGLFLATILGVLGAVALGALLQNTAAAIVASFGLPTVVGILGAVLSSGTDWFDIGQTSTWVLDGEWGGHTPQIIVSNLIWLVLPLALGFRRTARREVS